MSTVSTSKGDAAINRLVPNGTTIVWVDRSEDTGTSSHPTSSIRRPPTHCTPTYYPVVALGGTFDHLHAGHKILLSMAAWIARDKLIVGMTGTCLRDTSYCVCLRLATDDALLQKKVNKEVLQSLEERISTAHSFLQLFRPQVEYDMVAITDVCGPTGWDPNIQALVVSKETISGAEFSERP